MTKPLTRATYQRKLIEALREPPPAPTVTDFAAERAALSDRSRTPGIKITHVLDEPREWRILALVDREPVGDEAIIHRHRDLDAAVDVALDTARKAILQSGAPVSDDIYAKKVFARRA